MHGNRYLDNPKNAFPLIQKKAFESAQSIANRAMRGNGNLELPSNTLATGQSL